MKKLIFIVALMAFTTASFSQAKKDNAAVKKDTVIAKEKPLYLKTATIPLADFNEILTLLHDYRDLIVYNPALTSDQKVETQVGGDHYLRNLPKMVKVDSVLIKPDTTTKPKAQAKQPPGKKK